MEPIKKAYVIPRVVRPAANQNINACTQGHFLASLRAPGQAFRYYFAATVGIRILKHWLF